MFQRRIIELRLILDGSQSSGHHTGSQQSNQFDPRDASQGHRRILGREKKTAVEFSSAPLNLPITTGESSCCTFKAQHIDVHVDTMHSGSTH
ncbi:hypothetical protein PGT21_019598 [Puccinia graminis f. sp. tritici]|nr:hypothetical protein PGT21_019598 [Puccinia graminis f. sp. tritici]